MPPDLKKATERVAEARSSLAHFSPTEESLRQVEEVLTDGYALALVGDAWSKRAERHLHELIDAALQPSGAGDLRALSIELGNFQRGLVALRDGLGNLRGEYVRIRGPVTSLRPG